MMNAAVMNDELKAAYIQFITAAFIIHHFFQSCASCLSLLIDSSHKESSWQKNGQPS